MAHDVPSRVVPPDPQMPAVLEGPSREIGRVRERIRALAELDTPVLVCGEPGTGRRAAAGLLKRGGAQVVAPSDSPPSALPLCGTVLLPDVERLPRDTQLWWRRRVTQQRMGARLIAIASTPLGELAIRGSFDAELAARLERFVLRLPPLRERRGDLPALVERTGRMVASELGRDSVGFTEGALRRLAREPWPGNLAELRRVVERLVAFHGSSAIGVDAVEEELDELRPSLEGFRDRERGRERAELMQHLEQTGGNVAETAQRMARSRPAIYRLVEKHGIAIRRGR